MKRIGIALLLLSSLAACGEKTYIELDGHKLTERDLRKDDRMKERLDQLKASMEQQYTAQVQKMLQELAHKKMVELEAKEKGMEVQAYIDSIAKTAAQPTQEEVENFLAELKRSGQVKDAGEGIKNDIANYLAQQNRETAVQKEIGRLKKKYSYSLPFKRENIAIEGEPFRGSKNAPITIVEYTDFECPYCVRAQKTTRELRARYGDRIKFVFKDFPLDFHQNAMGAHIAANCVHREKPDAFWPFFDGLFDPARDKKTLQADSLRARALSLGVDGAKYDACLRDPAIFKEIEDDINDARPHGVGGTPAFFINGRALDADSGIVQNFVDIIEEELAN